VPALTTGFKAGAALLSLSKQQVNLEVGNLSRFGALLTKLRKRYIFESIPTLLF
jgi:hypothetical protein